MVGVIWGEAKSCPPEGHYNSAGLERHRAPLVDIFILQMEREKASSDGYLE